MCLAHSSSFSNMSPITAIIRQNSQSLILCASSYHSAKLYCHQMQSIVFFPAVWLLIFLTFPNVKLVWLFNFLSKG